MTPDTDTVTPEIVDSTSYLTLTKDTLRILPFHHPSLSKRPSAVDFETRTPEEIEHLTMLLKDVHKSLQVVGLSANELGIDARVFVVGSNDPLVCFNPNIIGVSKDYVVMEEATISFPGFSLNLRRPSTVFMTYQDSKGDTVSAEFSGIMARIILHEYDRMEGISFIAHASKFKRDLAMKRWKNKTVRDLRKGKLTAIQQGQ